MPGPPPPLPGPAGEVGEGDAYEPAEPGGGGRGCVCVGVTRGAGEDGIELSEELREAECACSCD